MGGAWRDGAQQQDGSDGGPAGRPPPLMVRSALALAPCDFDQVPRLYRFRIAHPHVVIGEYCGAWQGRIPAPDGETVTTRHLLGDLLDELDGFFPDG